MPGEASYGTVRVDEATLTVDPSQPVVEPVPAAQVTLPEPMLRYQCNLQGCCCGGWRIPFRPDDLVRLGRRLDGPDKERLTRDVELKVELNHDGERVVKELYVVDDDNRCRFLDADKKRCGVHMRYGLDALPNICVDFPVSTYTLQDGVDFYYDPVCPSVLDQLAESDAPMAIAQVQQPYPDKGFALRSAHTRGTPVARVGAVQLTAAQIDHVRRVVFQSLQDQARPVWQHMLGIDMAYAQLAHGQVAPEDVRVTYDHDPGPYMRFLGQCIGAHGVGTLVRVFEGYKRFIWAIPREPHQAAWGELDKHLRHWQPAMEKWLAPQDDLLRPLQLRYLAHRHFAPFLTIQGELKFASGAIVHTFATALRYASAFGAVLRRPVDRDIFKVALGCAEYVYRSLEIPPDSLPWFGIDD